MSATNTMHGWTGTVLRVNLTTGSITKEPLNAEWARDYVGGRGLGGQISSTKRWTPASIRSARRTK